jgi:hypothetical protein
VSVITAACQVIGPARSNQIGVEDESDISQRFQSSVNGADVEPRNGGADILEDFFGRGMSEGGKGLHDLPASNSGS